MKITVTLLSANSNSLFGHVSHSGLRDYFDFTVCFSGKAIVFEQFVESFVNLCENNWVQLRDVLGARNTLQINRWEWHPNKDVFVIQKQKDVLELTVVRYS